MVLPFDVTMSTGQSRDQLLEKYHNRVRRLRDAAARRLHRQVCRGRPTELSGHGFAALSRLPSGAVGERPGLGKLATSPVVVVTLVQQYDDAAASRSIPTSAVPD